MLCFRRIPRFVYNAKYCCKEETRVPGPWTHLSNTVEDIFNPFMDIIKLYGIQGEEETTNKGKKDEGKVLNEGDIIEIIKRVVSIIRNR